MREEADESAGNTQPFYKCFRGASATAVSESVLFGFRLGQLCPQVVPKAGQRGKAIMAGAWNNDTWGSHVRLVKSNARADRPPLRLSDSLS